MKQDELYFLRNSNNIEDEWDDQALEDAILAWEFVKKKKKLTVRDILETHKILMKNRDLPMSLKGAFRQQPVWIGGKEAKNWSLVPESLNQWLEHVNFTIKAGERPEQQAIIAEAIRRNHIDYEAIHPFIDGNGRTGRIFLNWERVRARLPILVILEKEKYTYYEWFK